MSAKHNLHVAAPIPTNLTPAEVIAALHDHDNALSMQALTTGHVRAPSTSPSTLKDTYWYPPDQYPIVTYNVTECIVLIPGVGDWAKKNLTFPSCFQDTPHGLKTRADTNGVIVRAEFRVVQGSAVEEAGQAVGDAEWALVEDVEVTCSWWMMPLVKSKMEEAHRDMCRKMIEKAEKQKAGQDTAPSAPSAPSSHQHHQTDAQPDENISTGFAQEQRARYAQFHHEDEYQTGAVEGRGPSSSGEA